MSGATHIQFSPPHAKAIAGLSTWMRFVGAFQIAVAVCIALYLGVDLWRRTGLSYLLTVVAMMPITAAGGYVWQGLLLQQAADYFGRLEEHEDDQDYLVNGFARLRTAFMIETIALGLIVLQLVGFGVLSALLDGGGPR